MTTRFFWGPDFVHAHSLVLDLVLKVKSEVSIEIVERNYWYPVLPPPVCSLHRQCANHALPRRSVDRVAGGPGQRTLPFEDLPEERLGGGRAVPVLGGAHLPDAGVWKFEK